MRIAIIGAGFSGLAATFHLLHSKLPYSSITIYDPLEIAQGVSGLAAGLLHPFSGAHAKLNWRGREGFEATKQLIEAAETIQKNSVRAKHPGILRLALTERQTADFQLASEKFPQELQWLSEEACQEKAPGCARTKGLWIKEGIVLFSPLYLEGVWLFCSTKGVKKEKRAIHSLSELEDKDLIIIATGAAYRSIKECSLLPLKRVRGQLIELSWPKELPALSCALNSHAYLLMTPSRHTCILGSTYEKLELHNTDESELARTELLRKGFDLFPPLREAPIVNLYAGERAVAPLNRPLIEQINAKTWVLSGMGSKGLLYHALFARDLVQKIAANLGF